MATTAEYKTDFVTDNPVHAGRVKRYHTWAVHHQQTIGEHCWQVALVYETIWGEIPSETERYIRHHDTAEVVVGDPPFPVKANSPVLKGEYDRLELVAMDQLNLKPLVITDSEKVKVKICDLLEMMVFGMVEREMGNLLAVPIVLRTAKVARNLSFEKLTGREHTAVLSFIEDKWHRHEQVLGYGDINHNYNRRGKDQL